MIKLDGVSFRYEGGQKFALSDINLSIGRGEFVGVIGSAGAGKTTLTRVLSGVVPHVRRGDFYGSAMIDGRDTVQTAPAELAATIGCVFQDIESQFVTTMVEDEVLYALENFDIPRDEIKGRVDQVLRDMGVTELRDRPLASLSGGQKQKVILATIFALAPDVIVLDEPTGELDPQSSAQVFDLLSDMRAKRGTTIVIVEQKIMMLCQHADRLIVMDQGSVVLDGPVRSLLERPDRLYELGVNCPRATTLAADMRKRGFTIAAVPVTVSEAEAMVREAIS